MRFLDDGIAAAAAGLAQSVSADLGGVSTGIPQNILPGIQTSRRDHRRKDLLYRGVQALILGFSQGCYITLGIDLRLPQDFVQY